MPDHKDSSMSSKHTNHCDACDAIPEMLSLRGASNYLGLSSKTLRRRVAEGVIPAYRLEGSRCLRIKRADLEAALGRVPSGSLHGDAA